MDVLLNDEERQIRREARAFLESEVSTAAVRAIEKDPIGYDRGLWKTMAELGWIGISVPVELGGQGLHLTFTGLLLQEVGRHLAPVPLHSTTVAALFVAQHGTDAQRAEFVPPLCSGARIATVALQDATGKVDDIAGRAVRARRDGDGFVLDGTRSFVDNAALADWILVPCRAEGGASFVAIVPTSADGLRSTALVTTAKDDQHRLELSGVRIPASAVVGSPTAPARLVGDLFDLSVALLCAQIVGATRKDMELAVAYAKERHAFGRPIGSFQALQHLCADMVIACDGAELLTAEAVWRLGEGLSASVEVSQAKAFVGDHCLAVCRSSQQIHGGIGFMMEFDLHLWYRRVAAWTLRLGSSSEHRRRVAAALFDGPAGAEPLRLGAQLNATV